jgi:hypothetical protein
MVVCLVLMFLLCLMFAAELSVVCRMMMIVCNVVLCVRFVLVSVVCVRELACACVGEALRWRGLGDGVVFCACRCRWWARVWSSRRCRCWARCRVAAPRRWPCRRPRASPCRICPSLPTIGYTGWSRVDSRCRDADVGWVGRPGRCIGVADVAGVLCVCVFAVHHGVTVRCVLVVLRVS